MRLSIIVTVYNRETYLERCLLSLLHQSLEASEYEIIVVNDGSTDHSEQIIDDLAQQYAQIHKINKDNSGVADTRNVGLDAAQGFYITYVDSDDYAEEYSYRRILEIAEEHDYDIVLFDAYKEYGDHKEYFTMVEHANEGEITGNTYVLSSPAPWNKLIKRSLFTQGEIRFPSGLYYEDFATIPLLANEASSFYYIHTPIINYYQENDSITRSVGYQPRWKDMIKGAKQLEQLQQSYHNELEFMIYLYLLVRTSIWFLNCDHYEEINEIADYMKQVYPNWKKNPYVKKQPQKEKLIATLFYKKQGKLVKKLVNLKKKVK